MTTRKDQVSSGAMETEIELNLRGSGGVSTDWKM